MAFAEMIERAGAIVRPKPGLPMFSILRTNTHSAKRRDMTGPKKTITTDDLQAEWEEIQAAQRDPAQFRPLYTRYYTPIFRYIYRRTADESLTADICSQVFLKAMQRLGSYEYRGIPFSAWLYRIASNELAQHYRQTQQQRIVSAEEKQLGDIAEEMQTEDDEQLRQLLLQVLTTLPEADMRLIEMRFFEQRPFKEIADILDMTESNAKVKTYRILERLKRRLQSRTNPDHP